MKPIEKAVQKAGGQAALAKKIGTSQAHVWNWIHRDCRVKAEYVLPIERATGVSRHELRPDLYPVEESIATESAA
jgi:DNA-binding transcriptional regulator YdaS (Cro superfamily)